MAPVDELEVMFDDVEDAKQRKRDVHLLIGMPLALRR